MLNANEVKVNKVTSVSFELRNIYDARDTFWRLNTEDLVINIGRWVSAGDTSQDLRCEVRAGRNQLVVLTASIYHPVSSRCLRLVVRSGCTSPAPVEMTSSERKRLQVEGRALLERAARDWIAETHEKCKAEDLKARRTALLNELQKSDVDFLESERKVEVARRLLDHATESREACRAALRAIVEESIPE